MRTLTKAPSRPVVTAGLVLGLVTTLAACTDDGPPAEDTAERVAEGLEAGTLPPQLLDGGTDTQERLTAVLEGLGERRPTVAVEDVAEQDGRAEVVLAWSWDLDGTEWSYTTTALLERSDDESAEEPWQVVWDASVVEPSLRGQEVLDLVTLEPERGDILGARGTRLVTERPVVRYGIDKTQVRPRQAAGSARRVALLLDLDARSYVRAVTSAGDRAFVEAVVLRQEDARDVDPAYADIPGAIALEASLPLAPTREFAAPLLGRVGAATAELIEESDGRVQVGDRVGLSGLQARYDERLTGSPGLAVQAVNAAGRRRTLTEQPAVDGDPLRTTLDPRLQTTAERVLAGVDGPASAVVALRPSDGAVLAAANGPGTGGQNIATFGQYAPGSTFKIVTTLALLRSGLAPSSTVTCPASVTVRGKQFGNYDDYPASSLGRITLREAFAQSCNTAFIGARGRVDHAALASAAEALGLGVDFDLGFPAYFGQVPRPASRTEAAADLIGQGRVLASPIVMAAVAASVAAGRTVVPHLLEDVAPEADPAEPLTAGEARALRGLMRAVVTSGPGSFLGSVPGQVGAKTGTAEFGEPGPGGRLPTHTWMVGIRGDLAVAVFVERGESGSRTAGPLLARFLS